VSRIIYDNSVIPWVSDRIQDSYFDENATSIGIIKKNCIIAGVVYNNYNGNNIVMSVAAEPEQYWATREFLMCVFRYPFIQLGLPRVTSFVEAGHDKSLILNKKLGFQQEGVMRCASDNGGDLIMFGMLKAECKWLKYYSNIDQNERF